MCYKRIMREWMREKMRRRGKRGPNTSESTGKIGQEIPKGNAPLQPSYPEQEAKPDEKAKPPVIGADLETAGRASDASADGMAGGTPAAEPKRAPSRGAERERGRGRERSDAAGSNVGVSAEGKDRAGVDEPEASGKLVIETQPEQLSTPPPQAEAVSRSIPRGYVVLAIGLPGSGKTTWFKRRGVTPLSSDMLRNILFDDITEQRYQGLVFSTLRSLLRARLIAKMPWNYVDATNLSPHERRQWIKMAKSFGFEVQAVFFDVPLEVCLERNARRERTVSEDVLRKMAERLKAPEFKEGFSKITLVRVKQKDGSAGDPEEAGAEDGAVGGHQ